MYLSINITLSCGLLLSSISPAIAQPNIGIVRKAFFDDERDAWNGQGPRPITLHIFYPTLSKNIEPIQLGPPGKPLFVAGHGQWNAAPVKPNKKPLIIMSHGTGGAALQMMWLATSLVKNEYIVVGLNHHGNTAIEPEKRPEAYLFPWERSRDIAVTITKLRSDPDWAPHIDFERIGLAGFSIGGYTVLSSVGAITDTKRLKAFCSSPERDFTCQPQAEFPDVDEAFKKVKDSPQVKSSLSREHTSYKITSVKAALAIAPAIAHALTPKSLKAINLPLMVIVGDQDQIAPAASNARRILALTPKTQYWELEGVQHYTFLSPCTPLGRNTLKLLCENSEKDHRSQIHAQVATRAVQFFNTEMKPHQ